MVYSFHELIRCDNHSTDITEVFFHIIAYLSHLSSEAIFQVKEQRCCVCPFVPTPQLEYNLSSDKNKKPKGYTIFFRVDKNQNPRLKKNTKSPCRILAGVSIPYQCPRQSLHVELKGIPLAVFLYIQKDGIQCRFYPHVIMHVVAN